MDNETKKFNESEFIDKLEMLYELEMQKPINSIDTDFVDEIVLLSLELKGIKTTLTPGEVEEKVRKIPFVEIATLNTTPESVKGRATKVKSHKILLIAAIISILVAIFTITSIAFDWNIFDELKNRFGRVAETPVDQEIDVNGISVYMRGESQKYKTVEEAINALNLDVLYPSELPDNISLEKIVLSDFESKEKLVFSFSDEKFTYAILFDETISEDIKNVTTDTYKINEFICYEIEKNDVGVVQVYFEYNGDLYRTTYNNKQDLIEVIENMKELK